MKVEKFKIKACCGTFTVSLKIGAPLSKDFLPSFVGGGFTEAKHFTKAGILYIENEGIIVTGSFGSDFLQIKCRKGDCDKFINSFEELLKQLE